MSNLPLAVNLWFVSLSSFSFIYLFCSVQVRAKRGGTKGNSGSKQTVPNSWGDQFVNPDKRCHLLQLTWCTIALPALLAGFINQVLDVPIQSRWDEWVDRAVETSQLQELSTWWCDFRPKIYSGYPWPCSSTLCKWLMLKATQSSARSENSWPEDIL